MADSALFVIGASGVGKTSAIKYLAATGEFLGVTRFFDSIGVPSPEEMIREFGSGSAWQERATHDWVRRIAEEPTSIVVLEGQTRPSFVRAAVATHGPPAYEIVLLDCQLRVREERLTRSREQPELASPDMDRWAAYLRGQADALRLPIIDTTELSVKAVAGRIREHALELEPGCFLTSASS